jgi:protein-S-isoprenylcysteine O-methyltransferase Ste14
VTILLAAWIGPSAQVRLEEAFLSGPHGDAYRAYCARTRRWL